MIWCGECGYKGKGLYLENEVYCPYCKATGNDIIVLPKKEEDTVRQSWTLTRRTSTMNYSSNDTAKVWAENLAASEGEAFEQAIKRLKPDDVIQRLTAENAELRDTVKIQSEQIKRLRECIARNHEDFYE